MVHRHAWRGAVGNGLLALVALVVGVLLAEGAAQFYAYNIVKQGKLFRPDDKLGWAHLPNSDLMRLNHDGEPWHIKTDELGIRGPSSWPADANRRMLILGDSFGFGEGVDLDERFDALIGRQVPGLATVNLSVMGYGTDQEFIRASKWADQLREGDTLLILTYSNDFYNIASSHHSGRSKPWFESKDGKLVLHEPDIGLMEILRDRSYLASLVARVLSTQVEAGHPRLKRAGELYKQILARGVQEFMDRGVDVVLVYFGGDVCTWLRVCELPFDFDQVFASACKLVTSCLALDPVMSKYEKSEIFLSDGHWNEGGHRVAAEQIAQHMQQHHFALDNVLAEDDGEVAAESGSEAR